MRWRVLPIFTVLLCAAVLPVDASAKKPARVAVLYFDYEGSDEELVYLRKGLASMLISDMSDVAGVELVERVDLEKVLGELDLNKQRYFDKKSTARVGKGLGADFLVTGRFFTFGGKLVVNVKVVEIERGVVQGVREHRPREQFFELEQALADKLRAKLTVMASGASKEGRAPAKKKRRLPPPKKLNTEVAAKFGKALEAADSGEKNEAKKLLADVVKIQPDFALAKGELAALAR